MIKHFSSLKKLNHPNLIKVFGIYQVQDASDQIKCIVVLEYINGGQIINEIEKTRLLSEFEIGKIMQQLSETLDFCHS